MFRWIFVRWLRLYGTTTFPTSAWAQQPAQFLAQTMSHGISVALIVPHEVYRQNALIQVTVRVQNRSHRRRLVEFPYAFCGFDPPGVSVLDDTGHIVYPPAVVPWPGITCPDAGQVLPPKKSVAYRGYAILRGKLLQEVIRVDRAHDYHRVDLATPLITVQLVPAPAPAVTMSTPGGKVSAAIARPKGAKGPMLYQYRATCPGGLPHEADWVLFWHQTRGTTLSPKCAPLTTRLGIAGRLNYAVATIDYSGSGTQPLFQRAMHR